MTESDDSRLERVRAAFGSVAFANFLGLKLGETEGGQPAICLEVRDELKKKNIPASFSWLPCGHYTLGEKPWVYLDGFKIVRFLRKNLK